jgi:uncharacterized membrane protein
LLIVVNDKKRSHLARNLSKYFLVKIIIIIRKTFDPSAEKEALVLAGVHAGTSRRAVSGIKRHFSGLARALGGNHREGQTGGRLGAGFPV